MKTRSIISFGVSIFGVSYHSANWNSANWNTTRFKVILFEQSRIYPRIFALIYNIHIILVTNNSIVYLSSSIYAVVAECFGLPESILSNEFCCCAVSCWQCSCNPKWCFGFFSNTYGLLLLNYLLLYLYIPNTYKM